MLLATVILTAAFLALVVAATKLMDREDAQLAKRIGKARGAK